MSSYLLETGIVFVNPIKHFGQVWVEVAFRFVRGAGGSGTDQQQQHG